MNETPSQTIGPFFRFGMEWLEGGPGDVEMRGTVYDGEGPVPDAMIEIWQPPHFGRALTEEDGSYRLPVVATGHAELSIFARGLLQRLVTRVYFTGEGDAVLALVPAHRRATLMARPGPEFDIHLQGPEETVFLAF